MCTKTITSATNQREISRYVTNGKSLANASKFWNLAEKLQKNEFTLSCQPIKFILVHIFSRFIFCYETRYLLFNSFNILERTHQAQLYMSFSAHCGTWTSACKLLRHLWHSRSSLCIRLKYRQSNHNGKGLVSS